MRYLIILLTLLGVALGAEKQDGRIVGGSPVDIAERPFQVAIVFVSLSGDFAISCGGSLITSRHVLTAAHCYPNAPDIPVEYVRAGSSLFNTGGVLSLVTAAIKSPTYDSINLHDDIAVLAIQTPIIANGDTIAYGLIGNPDSVLSDGLSSIISGWGTLWLDGPVPAQLQQVEVFLINWQLCHDRYEERERLPSWWRPEYGITEHMLCAGILDRAGVDACYGDSGGPLTIQGGIYGVVSWAYDCGHYFFPGVYAAVQPHVSWIVDTVASIELRQ